MKTVTKITVWITESGNFSATITSVDLKNGKLVINNGKGNREISQMGENDEQAMGGNTKGPTVLDRTWPQHESA